MLGVEFRLRRLANSAERDCTRTGIELVALFTQALRTLAPPVYPAGYEGLLLKLLGVS